MKQLSIILLLIIVLFAGCNNPQGRKVKAYNEVYICTGSQSKRYHKTEDCIGLSRCSRTIEKVSVKDAKELGRTPCGYCY